MIVLLLLLSLWLPLNGAGVELQIHYSAIQKVLAQQMYTTDGRMYVRGNPKTRCNYAYLENPAVGGTGGKINIHTRFIGKSAANFFGMCLGPGDAFDMQIVATPVFGDGVIRLHEVVVETAGKNSYYERKVRTAIQSELARKFAYNVADEARRILERPAGAEPYRQQLAAFRVAQIRVTPEALVLNLEFTLVVK